jgi:hypothetical protein
MPFPLYAFAGRFEPRLLNPPLRPTARWSLLFGTMSKRDKQGQNYFAVKNLLSGFGQICGSSHFRQFWRDHRSLFVLSKILFRSRAKRGLGIAAATHSRQWKRGNKSREEKKKSRTARTGRRLRNGRCSGQGGRCRRLVDSDRHRCSGHTDLVL